jgi:hypothetical protein
MSSSKKAVIVTTTYSANQQGDYRFQLALQMCQTAKAHGYPVLVVDGSPDHSSAKQALLDAGATLVYEQHEKGMGASRRQCISAGLGLVENTPIAWIEPEKVGMIPVLAACVGMVEQGYDIVIPWRNRLFADYPHYQALSEARANAEIAEITGINLDFMSGPRIMSRRGAELLLSYHGKSGFDETVTCGDNWEILFLPVLWALARGFQVGSCPVDYVHPTVQTAIESRSTEMDRKRDTQRLALVSAVREETIRRHQHFDSLVKKYGP